MQQLPNILVGIREDIVDELKSNKEIKHLLAADYRYIISIDKKGVDIRRYKKLRKRKKPTFTDEEMEKIKFLRTAIKDRTGIMYITGLVQQLLKEIQKHRLLKYDERTQEGLGLLYGKTIETLGKELTNVKRITGPESKTRRITGLA